MLQEPREPPKTAPAQALPDPVLREAPVEPVATLQAPQAKPVAAPTAALLPEPASLPAHDLRLAPAATAAPPRPAAITPAAPTHNVPLPPLATGPAGPAASASSGSVAAVAPGGPSMRSQPRSFPNWMQARPGQRSLAEMANEQINGGRVPRDPLADGVSGAALPDCIAPNPGGSLIGLVTLPHAAATGKCRMPR
jgi:hypothetical protein